ncbi:protoporphyrinogen oxidase [Arthrobacter sp. MYb227]|nr:protoporphyrinogen oxidase [Arthrobacter sp. MYb227]
MRLLQRARTGETRATDAKRAEARKAAGPRAAVIGGGISGLIAARELAISGHVVTLYEASDECGGCVRAHEVAGLVLDAGAESYATRSSAVADLLTELGLGDTIVTPEPGGAWLYLKRGTQSVAQPLPATGILGIPGDPWAEEVRGAVGRTGALRAAADLITPVSKKLLEGQLSLGALVRSRMGAAVLENLVTPVVSGVHSADPDTLDVDAVAPGLRGAVLKHGSLARAVSAMRAAAPAGSAVASIEGGMNRLTAALLDDLRAAGVQLVLGATVESVTHHGAPAEEAQAFELRVEYTVNEAALGTTKPLSKRAAAKAAEARAAENSDPEAHTAQHTEGPIVAGTTEHSSPSGEYFARVVIATGGEIATDLLAGIDPEFASYRPPAGAAISLVTLVIDKPELDDAPRGTGLLVAPTVDDVGAKALTHGTAKWQWLGNESGPGSHVLRLSYGRLNDVVGSLAYADDASLKAAALTDASTLLGIEITAGDVLGFDVIRYAGALPFASTGHAARVATIRERAAATPGLEVVGAWLSGTGLAAVVADTRKRLRISAS